MGGGRRDKFHRGGEGEKKRSKRCTNEATIKSKEEEKFQA